MCFILTEEQEKRILEIAMAVNNDIEKGIFYRYDGPSAQRQFCRMMLGMNKLFTKDDINRMSFQGINSEFAKKGTNRYSIFKYRGGSNCKHYWREIEVFIDDETGLPYEVDRGIVDDSKIERLNFQEEIQKIKNNEMNLYELVFEPGENEDGVYGVSLVSTPAISYEMLQFSEDKPLEIKLSNEEKRILVSPVLIPNQKIYRNFNGEEAHVYMSEETIEKLQQNFFKNGNQFNSKLEHKDPIKGVYFFESWIIEDPEKDKAKALGYDLPKGTWMMSMKVENPDIWDNYVKTGLVTGFSIDAFLKLKLQKQDKMNKIETLFKNALKAAIIEMEAEKKFTLKISDEMSYYTNEEPTVGVIVYDELGEIVANAEFIVDTKQYKTGENGAITSIEDIVEEEKREEQLEMSSEQLGKFEGEGGVIVFAEWLTLGKTLFNESQEMLSDFTFEHEGKIYSTDSTGEIVKIEKNNESPFWKVEMAAEDMEVTEETVVEEPMDKDAKIAELETKLKEKEDLVLELEAKLAEAESKINKLEADLVLKENEAINMSKQTPSNKGIVDRPVESSEIASTTLGAIRNVLKQKH